MPITPEILREYPASVFIETGSFIGDGIQAALDSHAFQVIFSIELSLKYYRYCMARFESEMRVSPLHGNSADKLRGLLRSFPHSSKTIWLDAHFSGGDTARSSPIMGELQALKDEDQRTTILIDDLRTLERDEIIDRVRAINPDYKITFLDNVLPPARETAYGMSKYPDGITFKDDILVADL